MDGTGVEPKRIGKEVRRCERKGIAREGKCGDRHGSELTCNGKGREVRRRERRRHALERNRADLNGIES